MTPLPPDVELGHATPSGEVAGFVRLTTGLHDHGPAGTVLAELRLPGRIVEIEWLFPFSWDSADRGVVTATRRLEPGDRLCLHAGPYGTADAAAHRDGVGMEFPPTGDGHRYRPDSVLPPQPDDDHQDTAAWLVARVADRYVCLAWEYSGHLIMTVEVVTDQVVIRSLLPADTFTPAADARSGPGPDRLVERRTRRSGDRGGRAATADHRGDDHSPRSVRLTRATRIPLPGGQLVGSPGEHLDDEDPGDDGRHRRRRGGGVRRRQGVGALGRRLAAERPVPVRAAGAVAGGSPARDGVRGLVRLGQRRSPVSGRAPASRLAGHLARSHPGAQLRQPRALSRSRPGPRLGPGRAEPDGHRLRSHLAAARLRDHRPVRLDQAHPRSRRRASTPRRPPSTTSSAPSPPAFPRWCWRTAGTAYAPSTWP